MSDPPTLSRRAADWLAGVLGRPAKGAEGDAEAPVGAGRSVQTPPTAHVRRLRDAVDVQAEEVEQLRRLVHTDAVTGLPNRRHFIGRLGAALAEPGLPSATVLLLRVMQLAELNHRLGREATDRTLAAIAEVLAAYPQRVSGAFAGRLNGCDFALCLPVSGVADETAATLLGALRASVGGGGVDLVIGGVEAVSAMNPGDALALADEALAGAEAAGPFCVEIRQGRLQDPQPVGERAWRQRIEDALSEGRASLGEFAVRAVDGRLLHLECPLRVQLEPGGPFQVASRWLAMASRGRLLPRVDLVALDLALTAVANDGQPRCVHVSASSLGSAGFVGDVHQRLQAVPREVSSRLWIELAEGPALERTLPRLREASAAWRGHGVHLGLEHAGASMALLPRLGPVGLDHLKVDARFVRGAATDPAVRQFAAGLVGLAHGMRWKIIAEGVDDARDLQALWLLGFDGATGPALNLPPDAG